MNIVKKDLPKKQIELLFELTSEELKPFVETAAQEISAEKKIKGFRPSVINPTLNQKPDPELERLWEDAYEARVKRTPFPSNVFDFGARNLALV